MTTYKTDFDPETQCPKCLGIRGETCVCFDDEAYKQIVEDSLLDDVYDWRLEQKYAQR